MAPRIGQADPNLAGLIILAGATRPLEDLMVEQTRYLLSLDGKPTEADQTKMDELLVDVAKVKKLTIADASSSLLLMHAPVRYWLDLRAYDPVATAGTLKQPLLILQGGRDYQVTEADFAGWKKGLGARLTVTFKLYPKLNHLFMVGEGKSTPAEYERPDHVAETVVTDIADWILRTGPAPPSNSSPNPPAILFCPLILFWSSKTPAGAGPSATSPATPLTFSAGSSAGPSTTPCAKSPDPIQRSSADRWRRSRMTPV